MDDDDEDFEDGFHRPRPWPLWVSLGLWGLPGRTWAWGFFWFSLALAVGGVVGGFFFWPLFIGSGFVLAALWYYAAIRWVDRYGEWP
jgi:hypothetical protein